MNNIPTNTQIILINAHQYLKMDHIILRYVRSFFKPLTNITYENPLSDEFYLNQLKKKINSFGFPADDILPVLQESPDTYITGSFLLHYLTEPDDWHPNDIDVFTTDKQLHTKLEAIMKPYTKARFGMNNVLAADRESYPAGIGYSIQNLYEWESNLDSTKKFQIILIRDDETAYDVINSFDFEMVKTRFDGFKIIIPKETMTSLLAKETKIKSMFRDERQLGRTLKRAKKYKSRGYTITYPLYISLEEGLPLLPCSHGPQRYYVPMFCDTGNVVGKMYEVKDETNGHTISLIIGDSVKLPTYDPAAELTVDDVPMT